MYKQYIRIPLSVDVRFDAEGHFQPRNLYYCDRCFTIDAVLESRSHTPPNVPCRFPLEFTVVIEGYRKKIYYERHTNRWFSVKEFHANVGKDRGTEERKS